MRPHWLFAAACSAALLISPVTVAQTRSWATVTTGLWNTPARWSPADAPNTTAESATFDLFGTYTVTLDGTSGPLSINHLNVVRGDLTLRPNGVADAQVVAAGNVSLAGQVTLAEIAGTHLGLEAAGALTIGAGTHVDVQGGSLAASLTTIAGGTATATTIVQLLDGATGSFGELSVAPSGSITSRATLDLYDGASATVGSMSIAANSSAGRGEVNVTGSTLTQSPASLTTVGAVTNPTGTSAALTVSNSGTIHLGSAVVRTSGKLINAGGALSVSGASFTVSGGKYQETGAATRDFSAAADLRIDAGGQMSLVGAPLNVAAAQTLTVLDGVLTSAGGVVVDGGSLVLGDGASIVGDVTWASGSRLVIDTESLTSLSPRIIGGVATLGGTLDLGALGAAALGLTEGSQLPLLTATSLGGGFDTIVAPALGSGLRWSLQQTPTSLTALVVAASPLAGDYNADGVVDAADYTVWRDRLGTPNAVGSHADWTAHYGSRTSSVAVPEPGFPVLSVILGGALTQRRRRSVAKHFVAQSRGGQ